jgi:hypothetical protein
MNISPLIRSLPLAMAVFTTTLTASPAFAKENGKAKQKTREKTEAIGKHGRGEGELPYGLERYKEQNGDSLQDWKRRKMRANYLAGC